ncbi:helix-turn-helix transcriptional regulator [Pendulispora rubella]|uniref:Helix-turn-helix transcriptional regulator n=1 Tax=Pendulispora rubella TaxID=2741070 RepID=A0ABZ2L543_9BACT
MEKLRELKLPDGNTVTFSCPVEATLWVVAGKWKLVILWYLRDRGIMRFSELRRAMPEITQQMLTAQLRELEADGIISRTVHPQVPPKVEYAMTPFGRTLDPLIDEMFRWGKVYIARVRAMNARSK